jgi:hypothetical protein
MLFDPTEHNYVVKLLELVVHGKLPAASASEVVVFHDAWCNLARGGRCNCDPEIHLVKRDRDPRPN